MLYLASLLNACCFCCYLCITCLYFYLLVTNDVYCWFHRRVSCCITMLHNYLHFSCLCNCYSVTYYADWPWLFPWLRNCYLLDYALCRGSLDSCTLCALICCLLATVFSLCLLCVLSSLSCNSDVFQYVIGVLLLPLLCYWLRARTPLLGVREAHARVHHACSFFGFRCCGPAAGLFPWNLEPLSWLTWALAGVPRGRILRGSEALVIGVGGCDCCRLEWRAGRLTLFSMSFSLALRSSHSGFHLWCSNYWWRAFLPSGSTRRHTKGSFDHGLWVSLLPSFLHWLNHSRFL